MTSFANDFLSLIRLQMCFQPQDQLTLANSLELSFKAACGESEGRNPLCSPMIFFTLSFCGEKKIRELHAMTSVKFF